MFNANKQTSTDSVVGIATTLSRVHILSGVRHFFVLKSAQTCSGPT